jgi:hypothetical protein
MNMRSLPWKRVVTYLHIYIVGREEIHGEIGIMENDYTDKLAKE